MWDSVALSNREFEQAFPYKIILKLQTQDLFCGDSHEIE